MRHRNLSDEELTGIINLKRTGTSWVKIQAETGINRRTAKRAYEKWESSQSLRELRDARKEVSAAEFRNHIEDLKNLAMSLAINSSVPSYPADMTNAEQFFSKLFEQDLLERFSYMGIETKQMSLPPGWNKYRDKQFSIRENELLFQSLQEHIRAEVGRWNALEQWKQSRDNSAETLDKLRKEGRLAATNFAKLEQKTFLQRIIEESGERKPVEQIAEAALYAIWRDILDDKLGQNLAEMVLESGHGIVRVGYEKFFISDDTTLAQKITHICNLVIDNLEKGEKSGLVKSLQDEVRIMKKASEELYEMLNPVKLTPVILRTRCALCPA